MTVRSEFKDNGDISPALRIEAQRDFDGHRLDGVLNYTRDSRSGGSGQRVRDYTIDDPSSPYFVDDDALSYRDGTGWETRYELTGAYEGKHLGGDLRATLVGRHGESGQHGIETFTIPDNHVELSENAGGGTSIETGLQFTRDVFGVEFEGSLLYNNSTQAGGSTYTKPGVFSTYDKDQETSETIARGILRFPSWGKWTFDASGEVDRNTLDATTQQTYNGTVYDPSIVGVVELRTESSANARWQANPKFRVELGARYETSTLMSTGRDDRPLQFLKPRALFSWTPTKAQQISFRAEREVSQLSFNDYINTADLKNDTQTAGNVAIVPDTTWVYEARYQWRSGQASFSAEYSYRDRAHVIDNAYLLTNYPLPDPLPAYCDPTSPLWTYSRSDCYLKGADTRANIGDGYAQRLSVSAAVPTDKIGVANGLLSLNLSYLDAKITDRFTGETHPVSGPPSFNWRINYRQDIMAWNLQWGFNLGDQAKSRGYRPNEYNERSSGMDAGLFAEYRVRPNTTLRVEVNNLLDSHFRPYREYYVYPAITGVPSNPPVGWPVNPQTDPPRLYTPAQYVEIGDFHNGRSLFVSLRRNF